MIAKIIDITLLVTPLVSPRQVGRLMLAIGACVAIIGIISIYNHWMMGKGNIEEKIWNWAGGILVLLLIQAVVWTMLGT